MKIISSDIRCCVLIRGTRSSTTKEMVNVHCEKYGHISYSHCAISAQGVMRGYNVVFKQEQSVNRFMDDRPHRIDGQSVKVRRCIPTEEEWKLTNEVLITTSDSSNDRHIFNEQTLRDYFSRYGAIRTCQIDTHHNRPCAYLRFADYDRVDQLINDKPHMINKIVVNVRKHVSDVVETRRIASKETPKATAKRRQHSSSEFEPRRNKQQRSSTAALSSERTIKPKDSKLDEISHLKMANDLLIQEAQSLMSPSLELAAHNEISRVQVEYERLNALTDSLQTHRDEHSKESLENLYRDTEILLQRIKGMRREKKTFADELFEKYTMEYVLSLTEDDLKERFEQLEKENQLLLLIKQNMQTSKQ